MRSATFFVSEEVLLKTYFKPIRFVQLFNFSILEVGPSLDSSSKFKPNSWLEVNKARAGARSSLISQSSIELFCPKSHIKLMKFSIFVVKARPSSMAYLARLNQVRAQNPKLEFSSVS
jgi:hypothetical protein